MNLKILVGILFALSSALASAAGTGTVTISGQIGSGQNSSLRIRQCRPDSEFTIARVSCGLLPGPYYINETIPLYEGPYFITFYNSVKLVNVEAGKNLVINLATLPVPTTAGYTFRVFDDFTSPEVQKLNLLNAWGDADNQYVLDIACRRYPDICNAFNTSPDALNGPLLRMDRVADLWTVNIFPDGDPATWQNLGRGYNNDLAYTGGFVSVFPGVYGIQTTDSTGYSSDTYGIVVK